MVSIRRRKLIGQCPGRSSIEDPLPKTSDSVHKPETPMKNSRPSTVRPVPCNDFDQVKESDVSEVHPGSSDVSTPCASKEQHHEQFLGARVRKFKRRKPYRRKQIANQEPCIMRGVYHKNMRWQAAIKVDKKQIHLGTFGSQEEAARWYDRAAFMRGRDTNFELSEEDKEALSKLSWEEYVSITRTETSIKRHHPIGPREIRNVDAVDNGYCDVGGSILGTEK